MRDEHQGGIGAECVGLRLRALNKLPRRHAYRWNTTRLKVRHVITGFECRRDNRPLLLQAPPTTPLGTGQYLDACHCTVSCIGANTGVCTGPYQPDQLTESKAA